MRILIAEDDFTSRTVRAGVLKKEGHQVETTVNGAGVWQVPRQPDAPAPVILDWMMPEMDGPEVVPRVRALKTDRPPYILMLTARGEKADIIASRLGDMCAVAMCGMHPFKQVNLNPAVRVLKAAPKR